MSVKVETQTTFCELLLLHDRIVEIDYADRE